MIRIIKEKNQNNSIQKLLDTIYESGTFVEEVNISDVIQIIYSTLYQDNKKSISITVDKRPNNSIDLIIENVE